MLGVGQKFPDFKLAASVGLSMDFPTLSLDDYQGKWKVIFFWPKDFTFVCPTEITAFGNLNDDFVKRNTQVLGASVDSEFVHLAWRNAHPGLKELPFPMIADIKRELSAALGIIDGKAGVSQRAVYIVDPEDTIRFVMVTDLSIGRNSHEVLRVLDALQAGGLMPCDWQPGQPAIKV